MLEDLLKLNAGTPGASKTFTWDSAGKETERPDLADGRAAIELEKSSAFGAGWPIAHVIDSVDVTLNGAIPPNLKLYPEIFDGEQWRSLQIGLKQTASSQSIRIQFEPRATRKLRIRCAQPLSVQRLSVFRYLPAIVKELPSCPEEISTRGLEERFLKDDDEPSFEALAQHGLSMPVWINTGLKDFGEEQAVNAEGIIFHRNRGIFFTLGESRSRFIDVRETVRRELIDGYLPGVITEGQFGAVIARQTAFAVPAAGTAGPALFIRIELSNIGAQPYSGPLELVVGKNPCLKTQTGMVDGVMKMVGYCEYPEPLVLDYRDGMLSGADEGVMLAALSSHRQGARPSSFVFDVKLAPGQTIGFDLVAPLKDFSADAVRVLQCGSFKEALPAFRAYWAKILEPAMKLDLPEPRLNNLYRNVLAQIFITAHGDLLSYGSMPSLYDGALYGIEEAYAMMALAVSGFPADAQRYMDGTYLNREFLKKTEAFEMEQRHQQYRNGLEPGYVADVFRISRDRKWISKHLDLLKECAEWTIANRRRTMKVENGRKPLYWGLLEKWAYGGDLAEQMCYPLFPNVACWRGLYTTAELVRELGDNATAERYFKEAADFRESILNAIDATYKTQASLPFLPMHIEATAPDGGEFYQLFAGIIEDLQFFEFTDKRADYFDDFLKQDNRLFCGLPRFRSDNGPGGLDALYGLGIVLANLHKNRTKEFLLGFYAFQAFNMEHTCFGSRETNPVYASDLHLRERFPHAAFSDPLASSSAVCLLFLRHMLVTEENLGASKFTGNLLLLSSAPCKWFEAGKSIRIEDAPTQFGKITLSVASHAGQNRIEAQVRFPTTNECHAVRLKLRHPLGKKMSSVEINGQKSEKFDPQRELVSIDRPAGEYRIVATYDK